VAQSEYKEDYERAKREERRKRADEYERIRKNLEEQEQLSRPFTERIQDTVRAAKQGKEKAGIIGGIFAGLSEYFKK